MSKTRAQKIAKVVRARLKWQVTKIDARDFRIAVALSGGIDSCSILAAFVDSGLKPTVVSYTPDTHGSTDFKSAAKTAENLGLPFAPAVVDMRPKRLERDMRTVIGLGYHTKIEVESLVPMLTIARTAAQAGAKWLVTGDQSGGYFILSRWAAAQYEKSLGKPKEEWNYDLRHDETSERIDAIRKDFYDKDQSNVGAVTKIAKLNGMKCLVPFMDLEIYEAFQGSTWQEVNRPRLKEPLWNAFERDWFAPDKIIVRKQPADLHKSDTGFAETFGNAMLKRLAPPGKWKSPIGLYRAVSRGEL